MKNTSCDDYQNCLHQRWPVKESENFNLKGAAIELKQFNLDNKYSILAEFSVIIIYYI